MVITINTDIYDSRESALEFLGKALDFPDYYRPNLDALNDCLGDVFCDITLRFLIGDDAEWIHGLLNVVKAIAARRSNIHVESIELGHYRHYKGGDYEVIGFGRHSETVEYMVIYKALYDNGSIWLRPASMWSETVSADGTDRLRFEKVGE